jgi:hypothetical protein
LLVYQQRVVQVLEGPRDAVSATFERIARDVRHANLTVLSLGRIQQRDFEDWTMRLLPLTPLVEKRLLAFFVALDEGNAPKAGDRALGILNSALARSTPMRPRDALTPDAGRQPACGSCVEHRGRQ